MNWLDPFGKKREAGRKAKMTINEEKEQRVKEIFDESKDHYEKYYKKLFADIVAYNAEHPIRVFYIHRWPNGELSSWCIEGPEYHDTTGSIWPGSVYYGPQSPEERWVHVSAYDHKDAIEQAKQMPEWEWRPKGRSKYEDFIAIIKKKSPNVEVINV